METALVLVGHLAVVVALFYLVQVSLVSLAAHLHIAYSGPLDEVKSQTRGHHQCKNIDQPKVSIESDITALSYFCCHNRYNSVFKYLKYFVLPN